MIRSALASLSRRALPALGRDPRPDEMRHSPQYREGRFRNTDRPRTMFRQPRQLFLPYGNGFIAEDQEERGILRQRIRKLDVPLAISMSAAIPIAARMRRPKRENRMVPLRLRLERIGIKRRGIVLNV